MALAAGVHGIGLQDLRPAVSRVLHRSPQERHGHPLPPFAARHPEAHHRPHQWINGLGVSATRPHAGRTDHATELGTRRDADPPHRPPVAVRHQARLAPGGHDLAHDRLVPGPGVDLGPVYESSDTGFGVDLTTVVNFGERDALRAGVVYGEGIASYMNDGGVDLAPAGGVGQGAELVQSIGVMVYYDRYWSNAWASSIGASAHRQDNTGGQAATAFKQGSYASTNILYTPAKNVLWGAEFLWGQKEQLDGGSAIDTRVQFTGQFKF